MNFCCYNSSEGLCFSGPFGMPLFVAHLVAHEGHPRRACLQRTRKTTTIALLCSFSSAPVLRDTFNPSHSQSDQGIATVSKKKDQGIATDSDFGQVEINSTLPGHWVRKNLPGRHRLLQTTPPRCYYSRRSRSRGVAEGQQRHPSGSSRCASRSRATSAASTCSRRRCSATSAWRR